MAKPSVPIEKHEKWFFALFSGIETALVHPCGAKAVFNPNGIESFSPGLRLAAP
jgi:hypothetical protein